MYYDFLKATDFNGAAILQQMRTLAAPNSDDVPDNAGSILRMIAFLLPRKEETLYGKINRTNMAKHLVSFIPSETFAEIKQKADLKDPVSSMLFQF